ncbi:unnamed protein product [Urochloa decumbens]|uniref:J domain-containing protein n=1 Tax=Urochloa decumbens TaxID=240449 RepID=A0ABC8Y616_9POAL
MAEVRGRKQAEKAYQRAEELFLTGNIRGAQREASRAKRLCPSLAAAAASALAAYEVHAAAAARPADWWRAVLGVARGGGGAATRDAVKRQFRRLSLLVHPDKNRSAAAEGAFKLLRQARDDALSSSSSSPPPSASAGGATSSPYAAPDEPQPWWREEERREQERQRAEARRARRRRPPPPPEAPAAPYRVIYCPFCKRELARPCGPLQERAGLLCETCHRWLSPPWQRKPEAPPAKPPPPEKAPVAVFQCPARCPECGRQYTSRVSTGEWCLQCKECSKRAVVTVQGPEYGHRDHQALLRHQKPLLRR